MTKPEQRIHTPKSSVPHAALDGSVSSRIQMSYPPLNPRSSGLGNEDLSLIDSALGFGRLWFEYLDLVHTDLLGSFVDLKPLIICNLITIQQYNT